MRGNWHSDRQGFPLSTPVRSRSTASRVTGPCPLHACRRRRRIDRSKQSTQERTSAGRATRAHATLPFTTSTASIPCKLVVQCSGTRRAQPQLLWLLLRGRNHCEMRSDRSLPAAPRSAVPPPSPSPGHGPPAVSRPPDQTRPKARQGSTYNPILNDVGRGGDRRRPQAKRSKKG